MQEIAIVLSSLAGVATAMAVRRIPKNKTRLQSIGASAQLKSQVNSLKIEKDILTKTIARLYQTDSDLSKTQKDKLLTKYQHQLGVILARLEKLEDASHHPDLGPVGDGLITLMDKKLSKLDERLFELSSKINTTNVSIPDTKEQVPENKTEVKQNKKELEKLEEVKIDTNLAHEKSKLLELTTVTKPSSKDPEFPLLKKSIEPKDTMGEVKPSKKEMRETVRPNIEDNKEILRTSIVKPDINKEFAKITEHKALPEPKISSKVSDDDFDDNTDDLDKIKGDIMKVLSKIEQAEVE